MHFFHKTVGLMAVLCAMPGAFAATARPADSRIGIVTTASSRMPTMVVKTTGTTSTSTGSTTSSALLANSECIDAYTECIKGVDACGENFEECTNKVLFHGKMPNCLSTLAQCSSAGVESLFGTSNVSALASGATKNTYGEITNYTYPTDGSVLGQMITAAAILNQYDTSTCVRRVTSCLRKDSVCGNDFELCTTNTDFRKQRVFCDSTLARCQSEGVIELLGSSSRTAMPTASSRIGEMITEGASLAAINAVGTCYKTVDQCILGACAENPYLCVAGVSNKTVKASDDIAKGEESSNANKTDDDTELRTSADVKGFIQTACLSTIGANKYCYATSDLGNGQMPTNAQLRDEDIQLDVFDELYSSRMNDSMRAKIADLVDKFDTRAKQKCTDTIKSCAMRVCGGGVGSACYASVFSIDGQNSINGKNTYNEIKTGCSAIVNTDTNCKYAAANPNSTGAYTYSYINREAFDVLFPEYDDGAEIDAIGVVAALNSSLATNYNDAAIAQMRKSCENVAKGCIKSMCGSDYTNCYRNRTDIISGSYDTGTGLDKSMNKMGGVLDNNVVIGLCLDTIKNASSCEEHLAIQTAKKKSSDQKTSGWGSNTSVRDAWLDANSTTAREEWSEEMVETGLCYPSDTKGGKCQPSDLAPCDTVDSNGCVYDMKQTVRYLDYVLDNEAETLLQQVMVDIEKEAQATYNAKLTREQNMCLAANSAGGILSNRDLGSTFMWAKLKASRKVPAAYNVNGLKPTQFEASNDLYGSFCRVRVTLQSDDKKIQEAMRNKSWTTAYFAVGDSFTCGSWIPERDLVEISEEVAAEKLGTSKNGDLTNAQKWGVAGASVLSAIAGGVGTDLLQSQTGLGGLLKTTTTKDSDLNRARNLAERCEASAAAAALSQCDKACTSKNIGMALQYVASIKDRYDELNVAYAEALKYANETGDKNYLENAQIAAKKLETACGALANMQNDELKQSQDKNFWNNGGGRAMVDVTGAGLTGAIGGVTTAQILKEQNRTNFTAEQQEWMNNIGRHITCYIGGDEAGNYGDIITTSLE